MPSSMGGLSRLRPGSPGMGKSPAKPAVANPEKAAMPESSDGDAGEKVTEVHDHGDGSFHTMPDGVQHPSIGHMHAHLSSKHGQEGESHFHAHHDGFSSHSHGVKTGGEADHREHEDSEGMKQHLDESMGGEEPMHEKGGYEGGDEGSSPLGGM